MPPSSAERGKLARCLALLSSSHAGERDAAGLAADRIVRGAGVSWEDLLQPPAVTVLHTRLEADRSWESGFSHSLITLPRWSQGQKSKLTEIAAELRKKGHA